MLSRITLRAAFAAVFSLVLCGMARSAERLYTVGGDDACNYTSIQAAVDAAQAHDDGDGTDYIRIANTGSYTAQAIDIGGQDLVLIGGYATCADNAPTGSTTLSGAGGASDASVLRITGSGVRVLSNLLITNGGYSTYGGGIDYQGTGAVVLHDVGVANNSAANGGGIAVRASNGPAYLELQSNTAVANNYAGSNGAGIYVDGGGYDGSDTILRIVEDNIALTLNEAGGKGGALYIKGRTRASIGSPGFGISGLVFNNKAQDGGGMAVESSFGIEGGADDFPVVDVFTTDAQRPARFSGNQATGRGGAIYTRGYYSFRSFEHADVNIYDYRIDGNTAGDGAAIYVAHDSNFAGTDAGSFVKMTALPYPPPEGAVPCATNTACRLIDGNSAGSGGSVIVVDSDSELTMRRSTVRDNAGEFTLRLQGSSTSRHSEIVDSLIVNNANGASNVHIAGGSADVRIFRSTIAGNSTTQPRAIDVTDASSEVEMRQSIVEPYYGLVMEYPDGANFSPNVHTSENIVTDRNSMAGDDQTSVGVVSPRFVDPPYDYRLRPGSQAVDFAGAAPSFGTADVDNRARDRDLGGKPNFWGPRDAGALELQSFYNLALNGGFDTNIRIWLPPVTFGLFTPAFSTADAYGVPGSGSLELYVPASSIFFPPARFTASYQCIHVPGPGRYRLTGLAYTGDSGAEGQDYPKIVWRYRKQSSESCGDNNVTASGELGFPLANGWREPYGGPLWIDVPQADWSAETTIELILDVAQNPANTADGIFGRFDNISLTLDTTDLIFRNGFQ